jgi:nucleoside-diphosphate-sugar epimerase
MKILITGAAGNAGQALARLMKQTSKHELVLADMTPLPADLKDAGTFVRCDTRSVSDVDNAVAGCDAVIHLAAWHCAHKPPVSDETIFAVNVDGTFNVTQACRKHKVKALVFASSMAYGLWGVYGASKVIGENLVQNFHNITKVPTVSLRYHDFVPKPYLAFGQMLFHNGVDRRDVATATLASLEAALANKLTYFMTIVHHQLGAPADVVADFANRGPAWLDTQLPGSSKLIEKYAIRLPAKLEQHDLSEADRLLGWKPQFNGLTFLRDLQRRDAAGERVQDLFATGELPA